MTTMSQTSSQPAASAAGIREASAREVERWLRTGEAILFDVREADEHARERIAGATLVPLSRFDASCARRGGVGQRVVFHCKGGKRAADACRMAMSGSPDVDILNLAGGIEAWKKQGLPVESSVPSAARGMISVMRQVQLTIGVLTLVGAALAYFVHPGFLIVPAFLGAGLTFAGATGTCGLAALLGAMPWNKAANSCCGGSCG